MFLVAIQNAQQPKITYKDNKQNGFSDGIFTKSKKNNDLHMFYLTFSLVKISSVQDAIKVV